jgi:hypothetical protein
MDNFLYVTSNEGQTTAEPFVSKSVVYITDQNNGSYQSGQIQLDTSSLSNSGKWCAYSAAYLEVPLVLALYPTAEVTGLDTNYDTNFAAGLKNGFYQLIHSLSVEYNNTTVIQLCPYTNMYINYKLMTSMSQDDLHKEGPSIGFWPDTSDSFMFPTAASPEGIGSSNNRDFGLHMLFPSNQGRVYTAATIAPGASPVTISQCLYGTPIDSLYTTNYPSQVSKIPSTANFGFFQRQKWIAFQSNSATDAVFTQNPYYSLLSDADASSVWKNYFSTTGTGASATKVWRILAQIRLKDLSDFFAQMPLVRGAYLRFIINTNLSVTTLTSSVVAGAAGVTGTYGTPATIGYTQSATTLTNGTNPVMFASSDVGQGAQALDTVGSKTWKLQLAIASLTPSQNGGGYSSAISHASTTVRLYCPVFQMNPAAEAAYLEANPTKTIVYRDIVQYTVPNVGSTQEFNQLITNGLVNPKTLIMVPIFPAGTAGNVSASVAAHQSVFASEPGTTSPLASVTNFNILLAGQTMWQTNIQYDWQVFRDELAAQNAINGGESTGLNSGLISEYDWSMSYRYLVCDLSRRLTSENSIPKSIQVLGKNNSKRTVTYFVFVECERSVSISLLNGALLG